MDIRQNEKGRSNQMTRGAEKKEERKGDKVDKSENKKGLVKKRWVVSKPGKVVVLQKSESKRGLGKEGEVEKKKEGHMSSRKLQH